MIKSVVAIGLTINAAETFMGNLTERISTGRRGSLRQDLDCCPGLDPILAVRHDLFAGVQSIIDDCCCLIQDTDLDDPLLYNVIAANHEGIRSVRTVLYCGQRHDDYIVADRELNTNVDE